MKKSIKVSEEVYRELLALQRPRETFSELIKRLLLMTALLREIEPFLRRDANIYAEKLKQAKEIKTALTRTEDPQIPGLLDIESLQG